MLTTISRKETACALAFTVARTIFCGYRAATQSIAHDEAFAYLRYLQGPWPDLWRPDFDASLHVLYAFLAKIAITVLGTSELTMRLPSVLAGFAMMIGAWRVLEVCERPWQRWLGFLAIGLHPLLLDFSVAARGYGISVAFLLWSIDAVQRYESRRAGVLLGLGIASNLTIAIPTLALALAAARQQKRVRDAFEIGGIAAAIALAICAYPMRGAMMGSFYTGLPEGMESLRNLVWASTWSIGRPEGLFGTEMAANWISKWVFPPLAVAFVWWTIRKRDLVAITFMLSVAGLLAAHLLLGSPYPADRTGLYLMALVMLALARLGPAPAVILVLLVSQFVTQVQVETFRTWPFSSNSKQIAQSLAGECQGRERESIRAAVFIADQPSLEYYRQRLPIECVQPIERLAEPYPPGYDYYVVSPLVAPPPEGLGTKIYAGPYWGPALLKASQ